MASLVPALIGGGASILSGITGGKGATKAAKIQAQAQQQALAQQQAQFAQTQANEQPYLQLGNSAIDPLSALLGLSGNDAQGSAISNLQQSPLFTSNYNQGLDSILQSASATGGLRGGNTNNSLAQFGSGLLSSLIQGQIGNLTNTVGLGANTAAGLGQLGQANSNAQTGIIGNLGNANATAAAAPYAAATSTLGGLSNIAGNYSSQSLLSKLLGSSTSGGGTSSSGLGYNPSLVNSALSQFGF